MSRQEEQVAHGASISTKFLPVFQMIHVGKKIILCGVHVAILVIFKTSGESTWV